MDNPDFYDQIMNIIEDFGNERYLLCGDFNLVQRFQRRRFKCDLLSKYA
jgi:hypothetical protein